MSKAKQRRPRSRWRWVVRAFVGVFAGVVAFVTVAIVVVAVQIRELLVHAAGALGGILVGMAAAAALVMTAALSLLVLGLLMVLQMPLAAVPYSPGGRLTGALVEAWMALNR